MSALRSARSMIRLVLAWFMVSVAVAAAAPVLRPGPALERLCSAGGEVRWVAMEPLDEGGPAGPDAATAGSHHTLDCPLCLSATPPSPAVHWAAGRDAAVPYQAPPAHPAPWVASTGTPFPPRAPPLPA